VNATLRLKFAFRRLNISGGVMDVYECERLVEAVSSVALAICSPREPASRSLRPFTRHCVPKLESHEPTEIGTAKWIQQHCAMDR